MIPQPTHCGVALAFSLSQAFRRAREAFPAASAAPVGLHRWEAPKRSPALRAGFLARNLQTGLYKKTKRAVCSPAPRLPAAWPRQAVRGHPVGSKLVRIKGAGMGPQCRPSASRDPQGRDQHHSTGFPTATEARKIRSRGSRMERNSSGRTGLRSTCRRLGYSQRSPGSLRLCSVGASCTICLGIGHDPTCVSPVSRLVNSTRTSRSPPPDRSGSIRICWNRRARKTSTSKFMSMMTRSRSVSATRNDGVQK